VALKNYTFVDYATQGYIALSGLLILLFHNSTVLHWQSLAAMHAAGLVIIHGLIQWGSGRQRGFLCFLRGFYPVLLYATLFGETGSINRMFFPEFLDPAFARIEQAIFGGQPSVRFMEKLPYLAVSEVFYASYFSYYLMIGGVGFALFFKDRKQFQHYVAVVSFLFYVCYLTYIVLPIIGSRAFFLTPPEYTLPPDIQQLAGNIEYPAAVKAGAFYRLMLWIYKVFEAPGAGFPSSHVAVAICTVYFSFKYLRPIRFFHLGLAVLLCLSTMYCRYHYVIDVIAGVITAAVVIPWGNRLYFKFTPAEARPAQAAEPKALQQV
jgi:membrane-associated phospholipid phosphatase